MPIWILNLKSHPARAPFLPGPCMPVIFSLISRGPLRVAYRRVKVGRGFNSSSRFQHWSPQQLAFLRRHLPSSNVIVVVLQRISHHQSSRSRSLSVDSVSSQSKGMQKSQKSQRSRFNRQDTPISWHLSPVVPRCTGRATCSSFHWRSCS